jgi:hypothetical protein
MTSGPAAPALLAAVPAATVSWLLEPENPAVAVLTRRELLREPDDGPTSALWERRNEYEPVAKILEAMRDDGSWDVPSRDYQKYGGSLWQIIFLGELHADGDDSRVRAAADYAFSRQLPDGSWSCNGRPPAAIPCLTANVARGLARLGYARDERIVRALAQIAGIYREYGFLACPAGGTVVTLNGYCHMLAPKVLLLLGEVPRELWPDGAVELRDACVSALRDKEVFRSLPEGSHEFFNLIYTTKPKDRERVRAEYVASHPQPEYGDKPGWMRFGFPLSYNSDALESLAALAGVGEPARPEYDKALDLVVSSADPQARWAMRNSFNGKMIGSVEKKGAPSKWLTLRALLVLRHFGRLSEDAAATLPAEAARA